MRHTLAGTWDHLPTMVKNVRELSHKLIIKMQNKPQNNSI